MEPDTKECPFCAETIKAAAIKCRYCGSDLSGAGSRSAPTLVLRPMAAQPYEPMNDFELTVNYTEIVPAALAPFQFFGVSGEIRNLADRAWSFHVGLFAAVDRHGVLRPHGMGGQTDTGMIEPGGIVQWGLRIALPDDTPPVVLGYHVRSQGAPGQLEVSTLSLLDAPEALGSMQHIMAAQLMSAMQAQSAKEMNLAPA